MHLANLAFLLSEGFMNSPFIVPVAGCAMILGIVVAGIWSGNRANELRSRERLECIARGMTPPPTPEELALQQVRPAGSLVRRRANIRLAGVILIASSAGLILFFCILSSILMEGKVLSGAAAGIIPLAIGVGFLIDTRIQSKEIDEARSSANGLEPLK